MVLMALADNQQADQLPCLSLGVVGSYTYGCFATFSIFIVRIQSMVRSL